MDRALHPYPRTFWILAFALVAAAGIGVTLKSAPVPFVALFMPSVFLVTTLCEIATTILLTLILQRSRRWELQPLIVLFSTSALLDAAALLTIRLPGQATSLIVPGNSASPWLFAGVHLSLSLCAVTYAAGRPAGVVLAKADMLRAVRVWFPAWTLALIAGICILIALCSPHGSAPVQERTAGAQRLAIFVFEFFVSLVSMALFVRFLVGSVIDWIDLSVLLTMIAGIAGLAINAEPVPRFSPPWVVAELLYGISATFVLIAAIRDLLVRLGESLRIEADALQVRVGVFEQNALVETSMLKSRFVAMVSHELRTPLGGIIGMAELLAREPLTERATRFTAAIRSSANGLHRIVDDLLDFSRAESGRIELEDVPFDLEGTLDDVVVLFREQARQRGVTLNAFVDPSLPRAIRGDQTRVKQVLHNLVNNALRFTSEGSVRIECVPGFDRDSVRMLQFLVSDTGIGIAPSAIDRIFDAFVQEDASTARRFGGTGLGLTIAKHLVELMGGRISVWSVVDAGTTFSFTLPAPAADSAAAAETHSLRGMTMLVFEEDTDHRVLLIRYADGWDMRALAIETLAQAEIAVAHANAAGGVDVVLVGAGVGDASASAFMHAVRALPAFAQACAIRIGAGDDPAPAAVPPGFDACVAATIRQSDLFATIVGLRHGAATAPVAPLRHAIVARSARPERILIAEDSDVNQMLLAAQLEHLGFRADLTGDGEAAVAAAKVCAYDLIFMDSQMPGIDGFEATRRIREFTRADLPIVAVTANVFPGYRELCLAAGMSDYLAKPALIEPLTEIVDRWLPRLTADTVPSLPPTPEPPTATHALDHMRERLYDVFHGDHARIERVIVTSLRALHDGATELQPAIAAEDRRAAGRVAHRLKGVALEIGSAGVAESAQQIERAIEALAWDEAERARVRFGDMLETLLTFDRAQA